MPHRLWFFLIPSLEFVTFLLIADLLGFWPTVGLLLLTSLIGLGVLRWLSAAVLSRAHQQINQSPFRPEDLAASIWLAAAGLLLTIPGFVSDFLALALFIPIVRRLLGRWLLLRLHVHAGTPRRSPASTSTPNSPAAAPGPNSVIDVEFEDISPPPRS